MARDRRASRKAQPEGLRVAVTGAAGYIGRALCRCLAAQRDVGSIVAIDVRESIPPLVGPKFDVRTADIAEPGLDRVLHNVNAVVHLAFVLDSAAPDVLAERVNLQGTRNVFHAAIAAGAHKLVMASSTSAYGAEPCPPTRLTELQPLRARQGFRYAWHKVEVERWLDGLERRNPSVEIVRLRLATVLGPRPRPGAVTSLLMLPVLALPSGFRAQVVHVEDVADAFAASLRTGVRGPYNIAAEPPLDLEQIARVAGQHFVVVPDTVAAAAVAVARLLGARDPDRLDFLRRSVLVDTRKARRELGWAPAHDGRSCLRALLRPGPG